MRFREGKGEEGRVEHNLVRGVTSWAGEPPLAGEAGRGSRGAIRRYIYGVPPVVGTYHSYTTTAWWCSTIKRIGHSSY